LDIEKTAHAARGKPDLKKKSFQDLLVRILCIIFCSRAGTGEARRVTHHHVATHCRQT
jgi:hypothetical protein